ncbi:MAG: protein tyrosine phosphatase [Polyangiaceae bacterium]|nr:protein tyrosine phosphatase [Polyangiaceae bacterium]
MARALIDLHCHWIPNIDDGAGSEAQALAMLHELAALGFELVIATPHMRPGLFDNSRQDLEAAFQKVLPLVECTPGLPRVALSSEHYLDELVYSRLLSGAALPYPGGRAVLIEFNFVEPPPMVEHRLGDLARRGLTAVIAHPERCAYFKDAPDRLERLIDAGAGVLLSAGSLDGAYGRATQRCAEALLERGLYHACSSDAHCPEDVERVSAALELIERRYGADEADFLFRTGPSELLSGHLPG